MRKLITAATVAGVGGLCLLGLAGTAVAATTEAGTANTPTITRATSSYSSPSNQTGRIHTFLRGEQVQTLCFSEGQQLGQNPLWFHVAQDGQSLGFVHRDAIGGVPANLKHC